MPEEPNRSRKRPTNEGADRRLTQSANTCHAVSF